MRLLIILLFVFLYFTPISAFKTIHFAMSMKANARIKVTKATSEELARV